MNKNRNIFSSSNSFGFLDLVEEESEAILRLRDKIDVLEEKKAKLITQERILQAKEKSKRKLIKNIRDTVKKKLSIRQLEDMFGSKIERIEDQIDSIDGQIDLLEIKIDLLQDREITRRKADNSKKEREESVDILQYMPDEFSKAPQLQEEGITLGQLLILLTGLGVVSTVAKRYINSKKKISEVVAKAQETKPTYQRSDFGITWDDASQVTNKEYKSGSTKFNATVHITDVVSAIEMLQFDIDQFVKANATNAANLGEIIATVTDLADSTMNIYDNHKSGKIVLSATDALDIKSKTFSKIADIKKQIRTLKYNKVITESLKYLFM